MTCAYSVFVCLVSQSCPTLCDPMDCRPPGSSVPGDFPGKNTGVGCHGLLQGFFPTQGSNPGLPHCRRVLYHLSHQGSRLNHKTLPQSYTGCDQPPSLLLLSLLRERDANPWVLHTEGREESHSPTAEAAGRRLANSL